MRGASATETLIANHPQWKIRVFAIWEPILPTDWTSPSRSALGRLSDTRVRQFWDPKHEVSKELRQANTAPSEQQPNSGKGFYWDEALLYPAYEQWNGAKPVFWQGPVFRVIGGLQAAIKDTIPLRPRRQSGT